MGCGEMCIDLYRTWPTNLLPGFPILFMMTTFNHLARWRQPVVTLGTKNEFVFGVNVAWFGGGKGYAHDLGPEPEHPDYGVGYDADEVISDN